MAWQDRSYYRDPSSGPMSPLMWLWAGRVSLFTAFGIRVYAHASLVVCVALVLLLGLGPGFTWQDRVESMSMLFLIVLLHEFGHCFAARWVGGEADEIVMHPLGGLALARPPRRWGATFITVAAGPAVNVVICIICGAILFSLTGWLPWDPTRFHPMGDFYSWLNIWRWVGWIYQTSYFLLIFNILPIYPLDGGQMLQSLLWWRLGYFRATNIACAVGIVGGIIMAAIGIATFSLLLILIAASCVLACVQTRRLLAAMGPEEYADETDYSAAYDNSIGRSTATKTKPKSRWRMKRAAKRAKKIAGQERAEREQIDAILAKVSAHGMHSLTWREKRTLKKATEAQRERDRGMSQVKWQ